MTLSLHQVRVVLCGTPLLPGTLTLTGLRVVAMGGVQWLQPFLQPGEAGDVLQRKVCGHVRAQGGMQVDGQAWEGTGGKSHSPVSEPRYCAH